MVRNEPAWRSSSPSSRSCGVPETHVRPTGARSRHRAIGGLGKVRLRRYGRRASANFGRIRQSVGNAPRSISLYNVPTGSPPAAIPRESTMASVQHIGLDEVARWFEGLADARSTVNRQHPLVTVLAIALTPVLAAAT